MQLIWCLELDEPSEFGEPERIAPDGIVELVVHYRGRMSVRFDGKGFRRTPRSSLVCQTRRFVEITAPEPVGFVSVRFRPWGALHFMDAPVSDFADRIVGADDVWGVDVPELEERLAGAAGTAERVRLVEAFLLRRLRRHGREGVEAAVRSVWRRHGNIRVPELCEDLGVSDRTAQRVFREAVGMPPKSYARLVRFLRACALLRRCGWRSLAEVAHTCGYYDQAHLDGDFRDFSGLTPGEFVAASRFSFLELD